MKENWFALFLCINKEISIDKALSKMGVNKKNDCSNRCGNSTYSKYSDSEKEMIFKLKSEGKTYSEIGEMLGMTRSQAAGIIRYYKIKKATKNPDQSVQSSMRKSTAPLYHRMEVMQIASQM